MDKRLSLGRAGLPELIVNHCCGPLLFLCVLLLIIVPETRAANELPAVTVTGRVTPTPTPTGDAVYRDWVERSPDMRWPTPMFNGAAPVFAHNQIVINASCEAVWDRLVHAELWPKWCSYCGKVRIWGGSQALQKNSKFTWVSSDLPQQLALGVLNHASWVDALVVECSPPNRLGFRSFGRAWTERGPLVSSYHNWFIKPLGPRKCLVTFEEVATGRSAIFARMAYPEVVHVSHDNWLQGLKRISETHD